MSGGVDSSVVAYLLKKEGYEVIGVTMLTWQSEDSTVRDAKAVAEALGIEHHVVDYQDRFRCGVVDYFVEEYLNGRTPNPCVVCNRRIKWEALLETASKLGATYIATGHYARIDRLQNGRVAVRNSVTAAKDQTYALYNLTQEQLRHTLMPAGAYTKEEIRSLAKEAQLPVADKPDSQDICFIEGDDYAGLIKDLAGDRVPPCGNFVTVDGKILGQHKGITHYTIGQRRGLDLPMGERVFVVEIRPETNEVVIGKNEDIFTKTLECDNVNFMAIEDLDAPLRVKAKIRYNHPGEFCVLEKLVDGKFRCTFEKPVRAVTPGQAVVFYDGEYVLGGGTILRSV
jgi:tRNA-specific 2-thiouridylase